MIDHATRRHSGSWRRPLTTSRSAWLSPRLLSVMAWSVACTAIICMAAARPADAQVDQPYSLATVLSLLQRGAGSARVLQLATASCITFALDAPTERRLRQAGADSALVNGLRRACRPATAAHAPATAAPGLTPPPSSKITDADFVFIRPGTFQMGDLAGDGDPDELPVHTVTLTHGFYLQKTEVTQAQWETVMGSNPSYFTFCPRCPVEEVSYDDIQQFIAALNARSPGKQYRLPTEAEWEYAARAGSAGDYGVPGDPTAGGWISTNSINETHPVGELQPNAWGLYDMEGNVWEWVHDWFAPYTAAPVADPTGPDSGEFRVLRGGSWRHSASFARSSFRGSTDPTNTSYFYGFRLARSR